MKKTAVQMAIDKIQIRLDQYGGDLLLPILSNIKRELEELRDTSEREQIEEAFNEGATDMEQFQLRKTDGNIYYNQTFRQDGE